MKQNKIFPNTQEEKLWLTEFIAYSIKHDLKYDAAYIIKDLYEQGLTPEEAVLKLLP